MTLRRGTSLLDLLPQTTNLAGALPDGIVDRIGVLTVLEHRSAVSDTVVFHHGTLQDVTDVLGFDTSQLSFQIPGLTTGLLFRLAIRRTATTTADTQEPAPSSWVLDILIENAEVRIPGLRPALVAGGIGTDPLHLEPNPDPKAGPVALQVSGVIRISGGGSNGTSVEVIDDPDPFDPDAPTGAVVRLTAKPPNVLIGNTQFGLSIDNFVFDLSKTFTPAEIVARGHGEDFRGIAYKTFALYSPKSVASLSVQSRDVILGIDPLGVQGELALEFGQQYKTLVLGGVDFFAGGSTTKLNRVDKSPTELQIELPAEASNKQPVKIDVVFTPPSSLDLDQTPVSVNWHVSAGEKTDLPIPGKITGVPVTLTDTFVFKIKIQPKTSTNPKDASDLSTVTVTFVAPATPAVGAASKINVVLPAQPSVVFKNVTYVQGTPAALAGITFQADPPDDNATWSLPPGGVQSNGGSGRNFPMPSVPTGKSQELVLSSPKKNDRRLSLNVWAGARTLIGHRSADDSTGRVSVVPDGALTIDDHVVGTFSLTAFHSAFDVAHQVPPPAEIKPASPNVPVPTDFLAQVRLPSAPRPTPVNRGFAIFFKFGDAHGSSAPHAVINESTNLPGSIEDAHEPDALPLVAAFGSDPTGPSSPTPVGQAIQDWVKSLGNSSSRQYLIVGRTDDLWQITDAGLNESHNDDLAGKRAAEASRLLTQAGVTDPILTSIEKKPSPPFPTTGINRIDHLSRLALPKVAKTADGFISNPKWEPDLKDHSAAINDARRCPYRCAEIYAFDGTVATPPPDTSGDPADDLVLVPGIDGTKTPPPGKGTDANPPTSYRVRLRAKWDSPTVVQSSDWFPTLFEATLDFDAKKPFTLPGSTLPPDKTQVNQVNSSVDFWELLVHFAHDARTGSTEASGSVGLPDGVIHWTNELLIGALAFAPSLGALVDAAGIKTDNTGLKFLEFEALLAAGATIGELINPGGTPEGSVDIQRVEVKYRWDSDSFLQLTMDYVCLVQVNIKSLSLSGHFKIRYKNIGLRFETDGGLTLENVSLVYERSSLEIQDSGTWKLNETLGQLLRIAAARIGSGSVWIELQLEFALDLGVIRLDGAIIRITVLDKFGAELRGLTVHVDIPDVLEGEGSVSIGDSGELRALLALDITPVKVSAYGALALAPPLAAIEVGVRFPVGIPIGATGLAVFGFMGRFVANGQRDLSTVTSTDEVQRELDWFQKVPPDHKYSPKSGQYALGFGAVIGTMPDTGYSFNASGSLCVEFPELAVIFGVDATAFQTKGDVTEGGGGAPAKSLKIVGMTVIDSSGVIIGLRGTYAIDKVLTLTVPVSASFPASSSGKPWYIRIGTDNVEPPAQNGPSRKGSPVTMTLFPGSLSQKATGFLMFEERGIFNLANTNINLTGFSIGFGAGFSVDWKAGPVRLSASANFVVGIGTNPLTIAGSIGISGELSLSVVSLSLSGTLKFRIQGGKVQMSGHFCGGVHCWFFSIEGCIDITFVDNIPNTIPKPPSPISGVDLCDHRASVKGSVLPGNDVQTSPVVVWPDTLPVVHFQHGMDDTRTGAPPAPAFSVKIPEPAFSAWSGSTELKYAFRLESVDIFKLTGTDPNSDASWTRLTGPFDAAWWFPTGRAAVITGATPPVPPSSEEGRDLGLFWWHPSPCPARWLNETGGAGIPGDPAAPWGGACTPTPAVTPACAFGVDAIAAGTLRALILSRATPAAAFPTSFSASVGLDQTISPTLLFTLASQVGYTMGQPAIVALDRPVVADGTSVSSGWMLPTFRRQGRFLLSLPADLSPTPGLVTPVITIEVCEDPQRDQTPVDIGLGGGTTKLCETFDAIQAAKVGQGLPTDSGTFIRPESPSDPIVSFNDGGELGLVVPPRGLHVDLPGTFKEVTLTGFPGPGLLLSIQALDAGGVILDSATMQGAGPQTVDLLGGTIVRLRVIPTSAGSGTGGSGGPGGTNQPPGNGLSGSDPLGGGATSTCFCPPVSMPGSSPPNGLTGEPGSSGSPSSPGTPGGTDQGPARIVEICRVTSGLNVSIDPGMLVPPAGHALPMVVGVLPSGAEVEFPPTVIDVPPGGGQPACQHVTYQPTDATTEWTLFRIKAYDKGPIKLVSLCGVSLEAIRQQAADQAIRNALVNVAQQFGNTGPGAPPTRRVSLDANSTYQIRAHWTYQGWQSANTGDAPPRAPSTTWLEGGTDRFTFRTADWNPVAGPPSGSGDGLGENPADGGPGFDERTFDAHGLARFLIYSQPTDKQAAPVFLDDPLQFGFMVDHIVELLGKYGAALTVRVLRTDPPLGALNAVPPGTNPLDVTAGPTVVQNDPTPFFPAEKRIVQAVKTQPCFPAPPSFGSSTAKVTAHLDPAAGYDLQLLAVRGTDEITVARAQFRTSRYHNVPELVTTLGFSIGSPGLSTPEDFVLAVPPPVLSAGVGDGLMDQALRDLGMDPWPVPTAPRTTVIWQPPATPGDRWTVRAVLFEAEEPLFHDPTASDRFAKGDLAEPRLQVSHLLVSQLDEHEQQVAFTSIVDQLRNASGTRVLMIAANPIALIPGTNYRIELTAAEPNGVFTQGTAPLYDRPQTVILEGN